MKQPIQIISKKEKNIYLYLTIIGILLFTLSTVYTKFNPIELIANLDEFWRFLLEDFLPPEISYGQASIEIFKSIGVTVIMAISATFVGGILALLLSMFGSEYISPSKHISKVVRGFATFLRNIPAIVWAFILFSSLGIGTGVGFVALVITSFAFLLRAFIETIDEVSQDCVESLESVGASFMQRIVQGILPSCISGFISWFLYSIEVNIRASTVVGMVGGGGVGMVLFSYIKSFKYHTASGVIILIALMVILVDILTGALRKRMVE